jgi:hypothetical protein
MKKHYRKILLVFTALSFALTATSIMLVLHLSEHGNAKGHDSQNCPICQQGFINKNPAVLHQFPKIYHSVEISFTVSYSNFSLKQIVEFQFPPLRAPPFVSLLTSKTHS